MFDIVRCKINEDCSDKAKELGFSKLLNLKVKEGGSEDQNRKYTSDKQNDVLMNPELKSIGDKVHYRKSGLNQVLAKLAKQNDVAIGFGFSFILNLEGVQFGQMIGRMKQNVRICRKSKTKMVVCEGGSKSRDNVDWMEKFKRKHMNPIFNHIKESFNVVIFDDYPSLTIVTKKLMLES